MIPEKNVICIPYAGGSSYMYNEMRKELENKHIAIQAVDLPGKGYRIEEKPCADFQDALADSVHSLLETPNYSSNSVFGYSMGGLLAYEAVRRIYLKYKMLPRHLFLAACDPPPVHIKQEPVPWEKDSSFIEYLIKHGGITRELAENQDFLEFFLPIVRNDYRILDLYEYHEENSFLPMKADILYSDDETDITEWGRFFTKCSYHHFLGGHFFINQSVERICQIVYHEVHV